MPAERAGYTVSMFVIDVSRSMGTTRTVELPPGPNGEERTKEITNLEWGLQYVKLKIQEMIYYGRKTDQCGVVLFGANETRNRVNDAQGGYETVVEYIPIGQPSAKILAKLDEIRPSDDYGDALDGLIVALETQQQYLASKRTWTRKAYLVTDAEHPIEVQDLDGTLRIMKEKQVSLTVVGIDFDDDEYGFVEEQKSHVKKTNEDLYRSIVDSTSGFVGTCAYALQEIARPEVKETKSVLMQTMLRLGDTETRPEQALEIAVRTSKCTAITRPKSWKKFAIRSSEQGKAALLTIDGEDRYMYVPVKLSTKFEVEKDEPKDEDGEKKPRFDPDGDIKMEETEEDPKRTDKKQEDAIIDKEDLVRGFKYGSSYVPCPDGQFPRLPTKKGIDVCGFFPAKNYHRDYSMGEIQYVWGDPSSPQQQVALSSIVQAMYEKECMAIARWVSKDGMDPKMGVLAPVMFEGVHCFLWAQVPFADDIRKYNFASLDRLLSKKGEIVTQHPYLPTPSQLDAMDEFVDTMDLMDAERGEDGEYVPWFDTRESYNPAVHRAKQAMFHCAVAKDLEIDPLGPPHPELLKYFEPPKRVLKRSRDAFEQCKSEFKVKEVPKKIARTRKDGHVHAKDDDEEMLLLDRKPTSSLSRSQSQIHAVKDAEATPSKKPSKLRANDNDSDTEDDDDEEELLLDRVPKNAQPLPTPARSLSPELSSGREPGRIIGSAYPLRDFQKNIAQGDLVTKAVEDLGFVVTDIVMKPFAHKRHHECIESMKAMRDTSVKEDEVDAWNAFLRNLKDKCLNGKPKNEDFWTLVKGESDQLGLISNAEANKYGGVSDVTEEEATEFIS